jgi:hypothetical protein
LSSRGQYVCRELAPCERPVVTGIPIYVHNSDFTAVIVYRKDLAFFAGVALLWGWIGYQLDARRRQGPKKPWPRKIGIAGSLCGLVFGSLNGVYAVHLLRSEWRPERDVGVFGVFWSLALLWYFIWRLARVHVCQARRATTDSI